MEVRETRSGLLLAEETAAPRQIRDALKKIDPDLILGQEVDSAWSCTIWKLLLRRGDQPAVWLTDWREDLTDPRSRPRPLSFGIVEEAWALRKGSRRPHVEDPTRANEEMVARQDEKDEEETIALSRETTRRAQTLSPIHRSRALYLSRAKARREGRV